MDIKEIQSLIKFVAKSGASEVKLEMEDIKITIRTGSTGSGSPETTIVNRFPFPRPQRPLQHHRRQQLKKPLHQHRPTPKRQMMIPNTSPSSRPLLEHSTENLPRTSRRLLR